MARAARRTYPLTLTLTLTLTRTRARGRARALTRSRSRALTTRLALHLLGRVQAMLQGPEGLDGWRIFVNQEVP